MTHDEIDEDLVRAFGTVYMQLGRRRAGVVPGTVLELSAFRILWVLDEHGPRTMREIGELLQLEQSTVSRQVNATVGHGHLERIPGEDRTPARLQATAAGKEAFEHDRGLRAAAFRAALAELGTERVQRLVADLDAFVAALDRAEDRA